MLRAVLSRDAIMLCAVGLAGYASITASRQTDKIQEGRKVGSSLTCGVGSALTDGGQRFVAAQASNSLPPKLAEFLKHYGYPTKAQRRQQAGLAAAAYVQFIRQSIVDQVGEKARGIVVSDGHGAVRFDCRKFAQLAKVPK